MNMLKNQFDKSDAGKLQNQLNTVNEESNELKNDFLIKFQSFSQEIETLKGKLSQYEGNDSRREEFKLGGQSSDDNILGDIAMKAAQLETSRDYRSKYNLEETVDQSRVDQATDEAN